VFNANGNILTINEGGNTWSTTISIVDPDSDPTNEIQQLTPGDDGTNFWWGLGSSTDSIVLVEGTGIAMTRSGDNVTVSSTGLTGSGTTNYVSKFTSEIRNIIIFFEKIPTKNNDKINKTKNN
jgi:hypothetical protein